MNKQIKHRQEIQILMPLVTLTKIQSFVSFLNIKVLEKNWNCFLNVTKVIKLKITTPNPSFKNTNMTHTVCTLWCLGQEKTTIETVKGIQSYVRSVPTSPPYLSFPIVFEDLQVPTSSLWWRKDLPIANIFINVWKMTIYIYIYIFNKYVIYCTVTIRYAVCVCIIV